MARETKCKKCKWWKFSKTLGSPDADVWHCRYGFSPSKSCQEFAEYNDRMREKYYKEHPEELQMKLRF